MSSEALTEQHPQTKPAIPARGLWLGATLVLFLLLIALALWLLVRERPIVKQVIPSTPVGQSEDTGRKAQAIKVQIAALEEEVAKERDSSRFFTCPPGQRLPPGTGAGTQTMNGRPDESGKPPGRPGAESPDRATLGLKPLSAVELAAKLEGATALVMLNDSVATGFFIAPNLLVTNRHAVELSKDGRVFIASRSLGSIQRGEVLRVSQAGGPGAADFALVRMLNSRAPATLALTAQAPKLAPVVASGYPGLIISNDPGFRRLMQGDVTAAPDLNLTQGIVQSLQTSPQGIAVVVHTASILKGNSGGPLVDACGRAVGMNTFIAIDAKQSGRVSYAQASSAVAEFLAESGARLSLDERNCP